MRKINSQFFFNHNINRIGRLILFELGAGCNLQIASSNESGHQPEFYANFVSFSYDFQATVCRNKC